jgi:hypothetical protein
LILASKWRHAIALCGIAGGSANMRLAFEHVAGFRFPTLSRSPLWFAHD